MVHAQRLRHADSDLDWRKIPVEGSALELFDRGVRQRRVTYR
jgi:hypothetical protein